MVVALIDADYCAGSITFELTCKLRQKCRQKVRLACRGIEVGVFEKMRCKLDYAGGELLFPASAANGIAISKTFQVLYRNEEVLLSDAILYRVHLLVESHKV